MSNLEMKFLQHVRFWIYKFKTCQILFSKKAQRIRFWFWFISTFSFSTTIALKKQLLVLLIHENDIFLQFSCFFWTNVLEERLHYVWDFELKGIQRVGFWNKKNKASDFDFIILQAARFCVEKKLTHQILNLKLFDMSVLVRERTKRVGVWKKNASDFVLKDSQRVKIGIEENFNASHFE